MKIVQVTYKAKAEFAEQNKANIRRVMSDLTTLAYEGINYHVCLGADGQSFTHTSFFKSDEDQQLLNALESFQDFQRQLKAGGLETPPVQQLMSLVGASRELFPS